MSIGMAKLITGGDGITPPFSVFLTPSLLAIDLPAGGGSASSNLCSSNVTSGEEPFTYLWTLQSGPALTVNAPTSANTFFSASGFGGLIISVYRCTVTDSLSAEVFSEVTIETEGVN